MVLSESATIALTSALGLLASIKDLAAQKEKIARLTEYPAVGESGYNNLSTNSLFFEIGGPAAHVRIYALTAAERDAIAGAMLEVISKRSTAARTDLVKLWPVLQKELLLDPAGEDASSGATLKEQAPAPEQNFKIGDKVTYVDHGKSLRGMIKSFTINPSVAFVVFHCDGDWENYSDYTGQGTLVAGLRKGWL